MKNLIIPGCTRSLTPEPYVSCKNHEGKNVETNNTLNECTKEKEPEQDINPPWGRNFRGLLFTDRSILS